MAVVAVVAVAAVAAAVNYACVKLPNSTGMLVKSTSVNPTAKTYGDSSKLAATAKQSNKMNKIIKSEIDAHKKTNKKKYYNSSSGNFYEDIDKTDIDLKYSIGAFDYSIDITTTPDSYLVNMTVYDVYDFTEWKKGFSLGNVLNNGAFVLQKLNKIQSYPWVLNYQVEIARDDIN